MGGFTRFESTMRYQELLRAVERERLTRQMPHEERSRFPLRVRLCKQIGARKSSPETN